MLYPARLRDLLMHLGLAGLYQPKWSAVIHDEWRRNLLLQRSDINPEALARTTDLMNLALPDANVTGFETHIEGISLPDPDDRHVLAAAIRSNKNPPMTTEEFLEMLLKQGLPMTVKALRNYQFMI